MLPAIYSGYKRSTLIFVLLASFTFSKAQPADTAINPIPVSSKVQALLPNIHIAKSQRLTYRYPNGWHIAKQSDPDYYEFNSVLVNNSSLSYGNAGEIAILFFDPVLAMAMAHIWDYKQITEDGFLDTLLKTIPPQELGTEIKRETTRLGSSRAFIRYYDSPDMDRVYIAFRRQGSDEIRFMEARVANGELKKFIPTILAIAESYDYILPSPYLSDAEQVVKDYLAAIENFEMEPMIDMLCPSMQFLTNIVIGVIGEDMGQDPVALAQQLLPMLANFSGTSIDLSLELYVVPYQSKKACHPKPQVSNTKVIFRCRFAASKSLVRAYPQTIRIVTRIYPFSINCYTKTFMSAKHHKICTF